MISSIQKQSQVEKSVTLLSNEELLALSKIKMETIAGKRLSKLLDKQREEQLEDSEQQELQTLMQLYHQLWVRQSEALAESVHRGLRPPLSP